MQSSKKQKRKDVDKFHNVSNGRFTTNRAGVQLCSAFNEGSCDGGAACTGAHQCAKCLGGNHGFSTCPAGSGPDTSHTRYGKNTKGKGGKGRGGSKGKGGKGRNQW